MKNKNLLPSKEAALWAAHATGRIGAGDFEVHLTERASIIAEAIDSAIAGLREENEQMRKLLDSVPHRTIEPVPLNGCVHCAWERMKKAAVLLLSLLLLAGCATGPRGFPPVGIGNFERVDEHLFRGAQPNSLGLEGLRKAGIRTVINLRMPDDTWAAEADQVRAMGMTYVQIPMHGWHRPDLKTVQSILDRIEQTDGPVYVHCQHGCDRTGTIVACYRIRHGWSNAAALREAEMFGMSRMELGMKSFVRDFK